MPGNSSTLPFNIKSFGNNSGTNVTNKNSSIKANNGKFVPNDYASTRNKFSILNNLPKIKKNIEKEIPNPMEMIDCMPLDVALIKGVNKHVEDNQNVQLANIQSNNQYLGDITSLNDHTTNPITNYHDSLKTVSTRVLSLIITTHA